MRFIFFHMDRVLKGARKKKDVYGLSWVKMGVNGMAWNFLYTFYTQLYPQGLFLGTQKLKSLGLLWGI